MEEPSRLLLSQERHSREVRSMVEPSRLPPSQERHTAEQRSRAHPLSGLRDLPVLPILVGLSRAHPWLHKQLVHLPDSVGRLIQVGLLLVQQ